MPCQVGGHGHAQAAARRAGFLVQAGDRLAQRDRFLMKIVLGYPSPLEELEIVQRMGSHPPVASEVLSVGQVGTLQAAAEDVYCDRGVTEYAVNLVLSTRSPDAYGMADLAPLVEYGASPRASIGLIRAGRAMALLRGRTYVVPQDVFDVAPEILRHRIVVTYEALAQDVSPDQTVSRVLASVAAPSVQPSALSAGSSHLAAERVRSLCNIKICQH